MKLRYTTVVALVALMLLVSSVLSEQSPAMEKIKVTAHMSRDAITAGGSMAMAVEFKIAKGFHLFHYSYTYEKDFTYPTSVKLELPEGIEASVPAFTTFDLDPADNTKLYHDSVTALFCLRAVDGAKPGKYPLVVNYGFQTCNDETGVCLFPVATKLNLEISIAQGGVAGEERERDYFQTRADRLEKPDEWAKKDCSFKPAKRPEVKTAADSGTGAGDAASPSGAQAVAASNSLPQVSDPQPQGQTSPATLALTSAASGAAEPNPLDTSAAGDPGGDSTAGISSPAASDREESTFDVAKTLQHSGYLKLFLIIFAAGIGASLTPCVYPMIPITMSFFMSQVSQRRSRTFVMALVYVMGLALTYAAMGVIVAAIGGTFGANSNHPAVIIPLIIIFVVLGLSLMGVLELQLPSFMSNRMMSKAKGGLIGAFVMGIFLGFIAAPCVAPIVGSLLAFVAQTGSYVVGFWGMFVFAWGMGILFILIALSPRLLNRLPASGAWMESVKRFFAFTIFGVAVFYTGQLLHNNYVAVLIWGAFLLISAVFFGLGSSLPEEAAASLKFKKGIGLVLAVLGGALLISGMQEGGFIAAGLPGAPKPAAVSAQALWKEYKTGIPDPLELARREHKPVLLDFWATWCKNCKEMDHTTFQDEKVITVLKGYNALKIQAENGEAEGIQLMKRLLASYRGTAAADTVTQLPTYIVIDKTGAVQAVRFGLVKPEPMAAVLQNYRN